MPLEDLEGPDKFLNAFNKSWPLDDDERPEGPGHLRGLKNVVLNTLGVLNDALTKVDILWEGKHTFQEVPAFPSRVFPAGLWLPWSAPFDANYDFLRGRVCDGRTFGKVGSGATIEDDEMLNLYGRLWSQYSDTWMPVEGGRGAGALEDWDALKAMTLPDLRARAIIGSGQNPGSIVDTEQDPAPLAGENREMGQAGGTETRIQRGDEVGQHRHPLGKTNTAPVMSGGGGVTLQTRADSELNPAPVPMPLMAPYFATPWLVTY